MVNVIDTRNPIVRTEEVSVRRLVDVDGLGGRREVSFAETVHWLRECSTRAVFKHGGNEIKTASGFADCHSGFLSCLQSTLDEVRRTTAHYAVTARSSLVLEVIATVTDTPVLPYKGSTPKGAGMRAYIAVPRDWTPSPAATGPAPTLEVVEQSFVIWTSTNDTAANEALLADFRKSVAVEAPVLAAA